MLIATLSYSQNSFPKKLIIGEDTVIGITADQLKMINREFLENEVLRQVLDTTEAHIGVINGNIYKIQQVSLNSVKLTAMMSEQIKETNKKVEILETAIDRLEKEVKYQKIKTTKSIAIASGVTISAAAIFYFIAK